MIDVVVQEILGKRDIERVLLAEVGHKHTIPARVTHILLVSREACRLLDPHLLALEQL
jgi:hypothetical protein